MNTYDFNWLLALEAVPPLDSQVLDDWNEIVYGCRFRTEFSNKKCDHEDCGYQFLPTSDFVREVKALAN